MLSQFSIGPGESRADPAAALILGAGLFLLGPVVALAPLGVAPLAIGTAVLLGGLQLIRLGVGAVPCRPLAGLLMLLCLLGALSLLWTVDRSRTLPAALHLAALVLPGLLLVATAPWPSGARARTIENAFLAGLGIGLAITLVQIVIGHSFGELLSAKPLLNHITPKVVSRPGTTFALAVWPAAIILYRRGRTRAAWLLPVGYLVLTVALHHRASTIAMAVGLLVYAAAAWAPLLTRRTLAGLLVVLFVGGVPIAEGLSRAGLEDAAWLPSSARHRIEIWQFTADRVLERPLTGFGLDAAGSIGNAGRVSRFQEPGASIIPLHPHSLFLQVTVELGLPGMVLALGVALGLLAAAVRVAPGALQRFALAGFAANWVISALSYGAWQAWWLGSILMAATALAFVCREEPQCPSR